ncbi:hypothetical protein D3C84_937360 [compost metagenome]
MIYYRTDSGYRQSTNLEAINRLQVDFLAHSYLYYQCDIGLINDTHYDNICSWLVRHREVNKKDFENSTYYEYCKELETGSGYDIKEDQYPEKIKRICVRLLKQHEVDVPDELKEFE